MFSGSRLMAQGSWLMPQGSCPPSSWLMAKKNLALGLGLGGPRPGPTRIIPRSFYITWCLAGGLLERDGYGTINADAGVGIGVNQGDSEN